MTHHNSCNRTTEASYEIGFNMYGLNPLSTSANYAIYCKSFETKFTTVYFKNTAGMKIGHKRTEKILYVIKN